MLKPYRMALNGINRLYIVINTLDFTFAWLRMATIKAIANKDMIVKPACNQ